METLWQDLYSKLENYVKFTIIFGINSQEPKSGTIYLQKSIQLQMLKFCMSALMLIRSLYKMTHILALPKLLVIN
jgi:hypothetical protein